MRQYLILCTVFLLSLGLASCAPNRQQADQKLAMACQDSLKVLSDPGDQFKFIQTSFSSGTGHAGAFLRIVTFNKVHYIRNHGAMVEKSYTCSFQEQWSMFGYRPEFYNLEKDGVKYGNYDGIITGEMDDLMKITGVTENIFR